MQRASLSSFGDSVQTNPSLWWCSLETTALSNLWWLQCYLGRVGAFLGGGPEGNVSCGGENLIFDSLCCSIQAGNVSSFSLGRKNIKSPHFSWILLSSKLDFGFGDSPNKRGWGFEPGARWDLFGPLLASLNYPPAPVLLSPARLLTFEGLCLPFSQSPPFSLFH